MEIEYGKATQLELQEIFSMAGVNRAEATGIQADNNKEEMISSYSDSLNHGAYFLVARTQDSLIGWVLVDRSLDWFTHKEIGWISDVYVKKEHRQNGVAKSLIEQSLVEFKHLGYDDVRLNVFSFNEKAIRLYEKLGFKDVSKFMRIEI
ncbi:MULTISPECIES: GNAT family N-acetyltransferase [Mesobacillus]|uniref:GNAT family N-acetyltransferase n=1 Tax=Mesobacillus TaxID=2675231 RepID=UPI0017832D05|nr:MULTISPECIES: GNAT family N-acetyltransferase [Mesobacillus]MCM3573622.1 GNAT family N-acetyltransferase [Mesobacillus subterraneus]UYZ22853.1 GNAT family N-acetyltransferase [Mesobacillus jeotgali]